MNRKKVTSVLKLLFAALFVLFFGFFADSHAQTLHEPKAKGMSHVIVIDTPEEQEKQPSALSDTEKPTAPKPSPQETSAQDNEDEGHISPSLSREVSAYFVPVNDLKGWRYMNDLLSRQSARVDKALRELESDPSIVSPKGLLFAAEAYTKRHQMEKAARYYYLAQLRSRFDLARFPVTPSAPYDYGAELSRLSLTIGQPISAWALSDPQRSAKLFDDVQAMERETPYAYKPGFPIPDVKDRPKSGTWPKLHKDVQKEYFEQIDKILGALQDIQ